MKGIGSDRLATTLALLRVNYDRGSAYLDDYLPFVYHCLLNNFHDGAPVGAKPLRDKLREEFGLDLPLGVVSSLIAEAARKGRVREDHHLFFAVHDAVANCDLKAAQSEFQRRFTYLAASLAQFAKEHHELTWDSSLTKELLMEYTDGFSSDVLAAAMGRKPLPARPPHVVEPDIFVVHDFAVRSCETSPDDFDFLVGLVKARMLSDSLYLDIAQGQEPELTGVEVFLDGPILLWLLGCAGDEIQAPYRELIGMLKTEHALLRCFHHSVVEAQQILDAAAARKSAAIQGEQFFGDIVGFLVRSDRTRSDIALQAEALVEDLRQLDIHEVDLPERIPELQQDEPAFEKLIRDYIPGIGQPALLKDIDSLMGIHMLRRGRVHRTLASSRAVLVTHNYALFKASARFFDERRQSGRVIPHCVYAPSFTTLVWLQRPRTFPDLPRERLLADAFAALRPSDELWRLYNKTAEELFANGRIDEADLRFLRASEDAARLLMSITRGDPTAFSDGTLPELLDLYRRRQVEAQQAETTKVARELADEQAAHAATRGDVALEQSKLVDTRARIGYICQHVGTWISNGAFGALAVVLVAGITLGPVGPIDSGLSLGVQIACTAIAVLVGLWLTAFGGSLRDGRNALRRRVAAAIERAALRALHL